MAPFRNLGQRKTLELEQKETQRCNLKKDQHKQNGLDYVLALVCLDFGLSSVLVRIKSGWNGYAKLLRV